MQHGEEGTGKGSIQIHRERHEEDDGSYHGDERGPHGERGVVGHGRSGTEADRADVRAADDRVDVGVGHRGYETCGQPSAAWSDVTSRATRAGNPMPLREVTKSACPGSSIAGGSMLDVTDGCSTDGLSITLPGAGRAGGRMGGDCRQGTDHRLLKNGSETSGREGREPRTTSTFVFDEVVRQKKAAAGSMSIAGSGRGDVDTRRRRASSGIEEDREMGLNFR